MPPAPTPSEAAQPGLQLVVGHHIVGGDEVVFGEEDDAPVESGAAFKQVFAQAPDTEA